MEGSSTIYDRRMQSHAGYALIEVLAGLATAAWQAVADWAAAYAERRQQAATRQELQRLNDHVLKDIGLERSDIDGLFR